MFDSGISAGNLIESLQSEIDAAAPIDNKNYVMWLNETEQVLYTEIIKEAHYHLFENLQESEGCPTYTLTLSDIAADSNQNDVSYRDVCSVYSNNIQLMRVDAEQERMPIKNTYWYDYGTGKLCAYMPDKSRRDSKLYVYYNIRPALKTVSDSGTISSSNVMLPLEFVYLIKAKLRAEAYKLVNEGSYAANWLNEYNYGLENFKTWVENRRNNFGK